MFRLLNISQRISVSINTRFLRNMSTVKLHPEKDLQYHTDDEMTLYIKGFLSKGETPDNFKNWIHSHNTLSKSNTHRWGELAKGWYWDCGELKYPYPVITTAGHVLYNGAKLTRLNPVVFTTGMIFDVALFSSRLMYQYMHADRNTILYAEKLSNDIIKLSKKYDKVRVVAHSLGCKLLLNAIDITPVEYRPNVIHLLAPAIIEEEYRHIIGNNAARDITYIYYCEDDIVLGTILQFIKGSSIVGATGLIERYDNINVINVTEYFRNFWLVHNSYNKEFPNFINCENRLL